MIYNDYENELTDKLSAHFFCIYPLSFCIRLNLLTVTVFLRYKIGVFVSTPYIMRSILYGKEIKIHLFICFFNLSKGLIIGLI